MVIGEFQKNTAERVRLTFETYKGVKFVDVRAYYEDSDGELKPTKKGIAIAPDKIDALIELLRKAKGQLRNQEQDKNANKC
jgi:hypothetical protein